MAEGSSTTPFTPISIHNPNASNDRPVDVMRSLIQRHLVSTLARHTASATPRDWWVATALAVRDTIHERMIETQAVHNAGNTRRVYYMSLEYLVGRLFESNLFATDLTETARGALESLTVLAVIGATRRQRRGPTDLRQVPMFGE